MYSALAKIFHAFFATMVWGLVALVVVGLLFAVCESVAEILHVGGWLPQPIDHLFLALGGR
jgi:hypothetical protein